jgi:hypothetical protein
MNPRMRPSPLLLCAALACGNDNLSTGDALTTSFASTTSPLDSTSHPTSTNTSTSTSTGTSTSTSTGSSTTDAPCPTDTILCDGLTAKVCDGLGGFKAMEPCPIACIPDIGCAPCVPDTRTCDGDLALKCSAAGNFEPAEHCDPVQGLSCDPELGACAGACADLGRSYIGCEYYPTTVQQAEGYMAPKFVFAVAVANTDDTTATVTVTRGAAMVAQVEVQAASVQLIELPWVTELSDNNIGPTIRVSDGAYRLRSTRPVTVYQYNPLTVSFSNDASLLLPTNTWTGNYLVAAWPTINKLVPGIYAVTARHDNTTVTLQPSATGKSVKPGAGVAEDGSGVVILDEGDILQVLSVATGDLTGTIVAADKPVQVIGGHKCTFVPLSTPACDHLEESMFPIETLAREYVIVPPVQVPDDTAEKGQIVRIIASEANTTLTFTPEQPVAKLLFNAGDFVELPPTIARSGPSTIRRDTRRTGDDIALPRRHHRLRRRHRKVCDGMGGFKDEEVCPRRVRRRRRLQAVRPRRDRVRGRQGPQVQRQTATASTGRHLRRRCRASPATPTSAPAPAPAPASASATSAATTTPPSSSSSTATTRPRTSSSRSPSPTPRPRSPRSPSPAAPTWSPSRRSSRTACSSSTSRGSTS